MNHILFSLWLLPGNANGILSLTNAHNNTHWSLWININSDESCFGGPLITCLSQEMHFGWVSERIHNHFWSFCTRVDVAKRMNHILLKEIQEFLQERLFAKSTIKTFIIFIVATNYFHFITSNLFALLIRWFVSDL